MKILAVRAENLASHEKFEIDFTSSPLKDAGLYAITGETGSGKSTILDAICLALYNDTPRIKDAEREKIFDKGTKGISLSDPRNLLRKGTASGYAEVDFIGLDSKFYRARWSVRRSRDKYDGEIQDYKVALVSLITNQVIAEQKTQFKTEIERLVGLTFDQFTRTVMLAQGDFATFLKADKNDKAELLEKLTGTDIYSKISLMIFEKSKVANEAFDVINSKIQGITLLDEETLANLNIENKELEEQKQKLTNDAKLLEQKLEWYINKHKLERDKATAEETYNKTAEVEKMSAPRFEYLQKIDKVQGIRDSYKSLQNNQSQLIQEEKALSEKKTARELGLKPIEEAQKKVNEVNEAQIKFDELFEKKSPEIKKATEYDAKIAAAQNPITEAKKEINNLKQKYKIATDELDNFNKSLAKANSDIEKLMGWMAANTHLDAFVPKIELALSNIETATKAFSEKNNWIKRHDLSKTILENHEKEFQTLKQEDEDLQKILPTEVVELRKKLVEGEPCPVCGSCEHPVALEKVDEMAAKTLFAARERVKKGISEIEPKIQTLKEDLIKIESSKINAEKAYDDAYKVLDSMLKVIENWDVKLSDGTLANELKTIARNWDFATKRSEELKTEAKLLERSIKDKMLALEESHKTIKEKVEAYNNALSSLNALIEERSALLGGKLVSEAEAYFETKRKSLKLEKERLIEEQAKLVNKDKELLGEISQIEKSIKTLGEGIEQLSTNVKTWMAQNTDITSDMLVDLLEKTPEVVKAERDKLNQIKDAVVSSAATLKERTNAILEHNSSENKPSEEDTSELLNKRNIELKDSLQVLNERMTNIKAKFLSHNDGEKRIAEFKDELRTAETLKTDWAKLNELFGSANGQKFRVIAQGYTLDLLLHHANFHLKDVAPRYVLERISTDSLALQIVDMDMAAETRSVNTLSGGESFLVSLALALGLSSLSSNKMSVESLFIDEGFGSLDQNTLSVAMDTLDRLQATGRKIGVISHVEEMKERIPTQIQVHKSGNGASRVVVV